MIFFAFAEKAEGGGIESFDNGGSLLSEAQLEFRQCSDIVSGI